MVTMAVSCSPCSCLRSRRLGSSPGAYSSRLDEYSDTNTASVGLREARPTSRHRACLPQSSTRGGSLRAHGLMSGALGEVREKRVFTLEEKRFGEGGAVSNML